MHSELQVLITWNIKFDIEFKIHRRIITADPISTYTKVQRGNWKKHHLSN